MGDKPKSFDGLFRISCIGNLQLAWKIVKLLLHSNFGTSFYKGMDACACEIRVNNSAMGFKCGHRIPMQRSVVRKLTQH